MATQSSILAWRTHTNRGAVGLQSMGLQRFGHDWATELTCMAMQVGKSDLKVPWSVMDQAESVETAALADEQLLQRCLCGVCCTNMRPPRCGSNMGCGFWWERERQAQDALLRGQVSFYFKAPLSYSIWENHRRKVCNKESVENSPLSPPPASGDHPLSSHMSLECSPHTTRMYILWRQSFVLFCAQCLEWHMALKSHGRRSLVGCSPWGCWGSDTTAWLHFHFSLSCIGEGNGNPLQCSCLENPRDGGAWWAAVYGVAHSDLLRGLKY